MKNKYEYNVFWDLKHDEKARNKKINHDEYQDSTEQTGENK